MKPKQRVEKPVYSDFERRWVKSKDVTTMLNISRATLHKLTQTEDFPKPVRLNYNLIRWNVEELKKWREAVEQNEMQEVHNGI